MASIPRPVYPKFDPPGMLSDLTAEQRELWHVSISQLFDKVIEGDPEYNDGPRAQFFNPTKRNEAADKISAKIDWIAFPKGIKTDFTTDEARWQEADRTRDNQDEYCEWSVTRDGQKRIIKVTFTCEGPEYWHFLARVNPELVVQHYRKFVSPEVKPDDLFINGKYNPLNKWNNSTTNGAMHLVQRNNTLSAEIELAAAASIVRVKKGKTVTNQGELIRCSQYGVEDRNSDPHIGDRVNKLARDRHLLSLANPVGLYFDRLEPVGWITKDGTPATEFWKIVRGGPDNALRAEFEVPKEKGYTVEDITINGTPIRYASQIADFIHIKLTAIAQELGQSTANPLKGCKGRISHQQAFAEPTGEELIKHAPRPVNGIFNLESRLY